MNYEVFNNDGEIFIREARTGINIGPFDEEEAELQLSLLNEGGCFDGFTPNFMTNTCLIVWN